MKTVLRSAAPVLLLILLSGCRLFSTSYRAGVTLPDPAAAGFPEQEITGWEVRWFSGDSSVRHRLCGNISYVVIDLPRERPVLVSARPLVKTGSFRLRPAGYVGTGLSASPVELAWADGFAADYLLDLARSGVNPAGINVDRFRETVRTRCDGNPWFLDTRRLTGQLLAGDLWTYSFRPLERHQVSLEFDPGRWYTAYLPDGSFDSDGNARTMLLPAGTHSFLRLPEERVLIVTVDDEGRSASIQR